MRAAILYVMDISEQCGHTLEEQIELFNGIKPLFANKPLLVILNKIDVLRPDELSEEKKELIKVFDQEGNILLDLHNIAVPCCITVHLLYYFTTTTLLCSNDHLIIIIIIIIKIIILMIMIMIIVDHHDDGHHHHHHHHHYHHCHHHHPLPVSKLSICGTSWKVDTWQETWKAAVGGEKEELATITHLFSFPPRAPQSIKTVTANVPQI